MSDNNDLANDPTLTNETDIQTFNRLSLLSDVDYEKVRVMEAKKLEIRVSFLDYQVFNLRKSPILESNGIVTTDQIFGGEFRACELLDEIEFLLTKHIVLPPLYPTVLTLWIALTFVYDAFRILPRLAVISPEKRCGKTTLLDMLSGLTKKSLLASNISPAAIFRCIDLYSPTLIIDEADTFLTSKNDQIIGILNSGHTRSGAHVIRSTGDDHHPKRFTTWSPLAFASIKGLTGTIMDRSIIIPLRRKLQTEKVKRLPVTFKEDSSVLRQKLMKWSHLYQSSLCEKQIEPPTISNDRAIDNWLPLFTIANVVGGGWIKKVEAAYICLNETEEEEDVESILLLKDIKELFTTTRIYSADLVQRLGTLEERPWTNGKHGSALTQNSLASHLKSFKIKSKQLRINGSKKRGYELHQFQDAFERYVPTKANSDGTAVHSNKINESSVFPAGTKDKVVSIDKRQQVAKNKACTGVPLKSEDPINTEQLEMF